jgi:hypothetical protein
MAKKSQETDEKQLSPRMRDLILSFDAKKPMKRRPPRDAKGRFVSSAHSGRAGDQT